MALSEFTLNTKFMKDEDNNISDSKARLCCNKMLDNPWEHPKENILFGHLSSQKNSIKLLVQSIGQKLTILILSV